MQPPTVENVFARAWALLTRNWVIVVPGLVVGAVVGVLTDFLSYNQPDVYGDPGAAFSFAAGIGSLVATVVEIAGYIITQCYTAGMAGAAWRTGTASLRDGAQAVHDDAGNVFVAAVCLLALGIVALILAPFTLLLSLLAFYLFTLYTIPAAVVGNRRGLDAVRESFAITRARFATTVIVGVLLAVMQGVGRLIGHVFAFVPYLGPIVAAIIIQIVVSYFVMVIVGEYLVLRPAATNPR